MLGEKLHLNDMNTDNLKWKIFFSKLVTLALRTAASYTVLNIIYYPGSLICLAELQSKGKPEENAVLKQRKIRLNCYQLYTQRQHAQSLPRRGTHQLHTYRMHAHTHTSDTHIRYYMCSHAAECIYTHYTSAPIHQICTCIC